MASQEEVAQLIQKGNACIHERKYEEAILHYTHAIKLDPNNHTVYSNRSMAFLKIKQYYHAYEDAMETIQRKPEWAKGYFRKAEVESAVFQYSDALLSYRLALELLPSDPTLIEAVKRTSLLKLENERANSQFPWVGAGLGIIIGVVIVIADQVWPSQPSISHPVLMALVTIVISLIGFSIAKGYRYMVECQRSGLLDPPIDLLKSVEKEKQSEKPSYHPRFTKAQGRQKLKKTKV